MVPLVNKPCMAHTIDLLKHYGFTEIIVTVQYLANVIQEYFGDGESFGVKIHYSLEDTPLGTAGSVKNAQDYLDETFLVISGDALTDFNLSAILAYHREKKAMATLTLYSVPNPLEYGVVITDEEGRITQFLEKPSWGEVFSDTINTGIYVLEPAALDYFERGRVFDFSQDLFPLLLKKGDPLYGYVASGYWTDIGNIPEYTRANADILAGKIHLVEPIGTPLNGDIWSAGDIEIAPDAQLYGPIYLGRGVKIKGGVIVRGPTVIRDDSIIDTRAHIERSIIWRNSYIGERTELRGAIVGRASTLKSNVVVFEGAVLGDGVTVGESAVIHPNVKIWPKKEIETGAVIKSSIIWGSQARRVLFGRFGISGLVNVDITPEFATKLGAAYAATLPKGATVTMNRDPHRTPRMIKRAVLSGVPSAGVNVVDIRIVPIPVARYITRVSGAAGGVHVRLSPFDLRSVDIKFFDRHGLDIDKTTERKIENAFFREDFRRVYLDDIGTITIMEPAETAATYTTGFLQHVHADAIQKANYKVIIDYAHATTSLVLPEILNRLGVRSVALNATIQEGKVTIPPEEFDAGLRQLALITVPLQADLAVRFDVGGEKIFLIDDRGAILPGTTALAAFTLLTLQTHPGGTIAIPVTQPRLFEELAARYGGRIIRTRVDASTLMATATREGVILAGDGEGSYIIPEFQPAVDGMMALAKLLEMLARTGQHLSDVVRSLPPYYTAKTRVSCPWEMKGLVMRMLNEQYKDIVSRQIDGVKIELGKEWVLVLPDPDRPIIHIYAESASSDEAQALAEKYAIVVQGFQK